MTITLRMYERDRIVSTDVDVLRDYAIATFDTLSHAVRVSDEHENAIVDRMRALDGWSSPRPGRGAGTEYSHYVVKRDHPYGHGDVIRTTWLALNLGEVNL